MEVLPAIALGLGAFSAITSSQNNKSANAIANAQLKSEDNLINQEQAYTSSQAQRNQDATVQATSLAARRALAGNSQGFNGTILTQPSQNAPIDGGTLLTSGKTLLGQ